jgi:hypothetical protein
MKEASQLIDSRLVSEREVYLSYLKRLQSKGGLANTEKQRIARVANIKRAREARRERNEKRKREL